MVCSTVIVKSIKQLWNSDQNQINGCGNQPKIEWDCKRPIVSEANSIEYVSDHKVTRLCKHTVSHGSYSMLLCTLCRILQQLSCCWIITIRIGRFPQLLCFRPKSSIHVRFGPNIRRTEAKYHCVGLLAYFCIFSLFQLTSVCMCVCVWYLPLHYTLQGEVAQTVSKALFSQLHITAAGDTGEHHHQGRTLLTAAP